MNIFDVEKLKMEDAALLAEESIEIKGHTCYFIDFGFFFGYSVLVFKGSKHIYHANDYELHHGLNTRNTKSKEELKMLYISEMNDRLFTDEEIMEGVVTYKEYKAKENFLRNYWIQKFDRKSIFNIKDEPDKEKYPYYDPVSFCYLKDESVVMLHRMLYKKLRECFNELKKHPHTFIEMISCEFDNYEVCVSGRADEALEALGLRYEDLKTWQKIAVRDELHRRINEHYQY